MNWLDIFPLAYWRRTRAAGTHLLSQVLAWPALLLVIQLHSVGGKVGMGSVYCGLAWAAFLSLYELGYFMNDFWSQPREIQRGLPQHKGCVILSTAEQRLLLLATVVRIAFFLLCSFVLYLGCGKNAAVGLSLITGGTLVVFALHNVILLPYRVATLTLLHAGKDALIWPFVLGEILPYPLVMALIVPPITFGVSYAVSKRVFWPSLRPATSNINFNFGACSIAWLVLGLCGGLHGARGMSLLVLLAGYFALCSVVMTIMRLAKAGLDMRSRHNDCYHIHSGYSHDCDLPLESIRRYAHEVGYRRVFIADHAETFDDEKYKRLVRECQLCNGLHDGLPELIPGLEYPVHTQHILAIGLPEYVRVDEDRVDGILVLHEHCQEVIWAHPHFAIRRMLFEPQYRRQYFRMMSLVRRFEVLNSKSMRGFHYRWRHWAVAVVAIYLFGGKAVYSGLDAHTREDWERAIERRRNTPANETNRTAA